MIRCLIFIFALNIALNSGLEIIGMRWTGLKGILDRCLTDCWINEEKYFSVTRPATTELDDTCQLNIMLPVLDSFLRQHGARVILLPDGLESALGQV